MALTLANKLSISRMLSVPAIAIGIYYYDPEQPWIRWVIVGMFFLGSVSDAVDGFLARNYNQRTELGTVLDPLADKLLLDVSFIFLTVVHRFEFMIPAWVTIIVIARDFILVMGSWYISQITGRLKVTPRPLGKITTTIQLTTVIAVLIGVRFAPRLWQVATVATVLSLIDYLRFGSRMLNGASSDTTRK